jgi:GTP pyrophosphokinase
MPLLESDNILEIIGKITLALREKNIEAEVTYRLKHPKSVLEKMIKKDIELHEIKDLVAFRFIVKKLQNCYDVLDVINQVCTTNVIVKKDYIAKPKENGYRSLHLMISDNALMQNVEMQIRTKKMHAVAESGSASHSRYKDNRQTKVDSVFDTKLDEFTVSKACDIWHKFQWTIPELATYEEELKKIWHHYRAGMLMSANY